MSGNRQHRATPLLDLAPAISALGIAVKKSVKVTRLSRSGRKPTKAMRAYSAQVRATEKKADRVIFSKLSETTFYHDRYTIRRMGDRFEIWDAETHDVFGPYPTHADAVTAVRAL